MLPAFTRKQPLGCIKRFVSARLREHKNPGKDVAHVVREITDKPNVAIAGIPLDPSDRRFLERYLLEHSRRFLPPIVRPLRPT